ncbi:hypothetical protein PENTCL1PPCAC_26273 [Pristionchus entomophagus]|uniref:Metalloendopeptidase n=1 Tax=Pristionchus entomophagus TaxID=358040 RepID=A0AAV5UB42_9BILA|nr:hypothetical protein PENTCL1PPCAC_26273 [Pristionchus entomophagus]
MRLLIPLLFVVSLAAAQLNLNLQSLVGGRENGGKGGKGVLSGWKKRTRPLDKAHAFANLRRFGKGTRSLRTEDWKEHADQFCSLFPHHGKCRDGHRPQQSDLASVTKAIERRHQRRRIPKLKAIDWLSGVPAALKERAKDRKEKFGKTSNETRNHFRNACRSGRLNCRLQPQEARDKRKLLRDHLAKVEKDTLKLDDETADDNVEIRFDRTLRIKRALLEKANLTAEVDPIDDGIFENDLLLTETQSNMILNHLDKAETTGDENLSPDEVVDEAPKPPADMLPPSDPVAAAAAAPTAESTATPVESPTETAPTDSPTPTPDTSVDGVPAATADGTRKRRSGVFVEQNFAEKWDISTPIPYTFDSSIAPWDKTDISDALTEISRISCIRFQFLSSTPNGYHINFVKINSPTFCGLSYVGRVSPVNTVYLSFQCGKNKGVVMHETLHALGVIHQHLRVDRDKFIKVEWANVNPQKYDQFATADQSLYTSYGIKYSYDSIMHYNAYTNAIDVKKPTMIPLMNSESNLSLLGQRDQLSQTDVNLINKMYCKPASCIDTNIYCGHWALTGVCTLQGNSIWMSQNCRKSCNLC